MSRSTWALAETRRRGGFLHGAWQRRRLDGRLRLERRPGPVAVSATKYAVVLLTAGMLVMAAEPAHALAASNGETPAHQAGPTVLALGGGYEGGPGAVRVHALQRRLDGAGYSPGPIDGRYGPRTEAAVEEFQSARGLLVDGIAGPVTLNALHTTAL